MKHKTEILAPAGSMASLQASFKAGADAVYMGGVKFGARAYAKNPEEEDLIRAIDYAHLLGKRLYLTVNTLVKEDEIKELPDFLAPLYEAGLDAVLVQDFGAMRVIEKCFPALPIHLSTQMSITDASELKTMSDRVTRIVPARELDLEGIKRLKQESGREIEVFIHGALCYCYSGQCLFSSMCGDRSGNRGRCAQPCRRKYESLGSKGYLLSPKDICTIDRLADFCEAGVDSFKIEGRMKSPEYAAGVTRAYYNARALYEDRGRDGFYDYVNKHLAQWQDVRTGLMDLFNRGGFSAGYAFTKPGKQMMYVNRPNHEGVFVGQALITGGRASLTPTVKLNKGDVLEIRSDLISSWYSYTLGEDFEEGALSSAGNKKAGKCELVFKANQPSDNRRTEGKKVDVYRLRNEKILSELNREYVSAEDPVKVAGEFVAAPGEPLYLHVETSSANAITDRHYEAYVTAGVAETAKSAPATEEDIKKKLARSAGSGFEFSNLDITLSGSCFIPKSSLGALRREALDEIEKNILSDFRRKPGKNYDEYVAEAKSSGENRLKTDSDLPQAKISKEKKIQTPEIHVKVFSAAQLMAVVKEGIASAVVIDTMTPAFAELTESKDLQELLNDLPVYLRIMRVGSSVNSDNRAKSLLKERIRSLRKVGVNIAGYYAAGLSAYEFADEGERIINDSNLYTMNAEAAAAYAEAGACAVVLSSELTAEELTALTNNIRKAGAAKTALMVYGRTELMVSAQSVKKTLGKDGNDEFYFLKTEDGRKFPVYDFPADACSLIYDCARLDLRGEREAETLKKTAPDIVIYSFTDESPAEVASVLSGGSISSSNFGHFYKGIQ